MESDRIKIEIEIEELYASLGYGICYEEKSAILEEIDRLRSELPKLKFNNNQRRK